MSESDEHRCLVKLMAEGLSASDPQLRIFADLSGGFSRPPLICGFIPDVYAEHSRSFYIGEAKTFDDLETSHSLAQIRAFLEHVNKTPAGCFILGGFGATATRAKTLLRFLVIEKKFAYSSVQVFDGLDYWRLKDSQEPLWDLC